MTNERTTTPRRGGASWAWLCVALFVVLAASCGRAPQQAQQQNSKDEPRIVALSPAIAVMLRDLGFEDAIVGRHAYDLVLSDSIVSVGDQVEVEYERLLTLRPTHVYTEFGAAGMPGRLRDLAAKHGWHLENYTLRTLGDVAAALDDLRLDLGGPPEDQPGVFVDPAAKFEGSLPSARLARAWASRGPKAGWCGRVLLLAQTQPPGALGPGSFHHEMLARLGGTPAIDTGRAFQELDAEDVLRLAPDAIVLFAPRARVEGDRFGEPAVLAWDEIVARLGAIGRLDIPACRARRVVVIEHPLGLLPSSALGEVARELGDVLVGWGEEG